RLRRHILGLDYGGSLESVGPLRTALAAGLHVVRGTREIILVWRAQHAACRTGYGVSGVRQLAHLFIAAFHHNFPPSLYYRTRLFRLARDRWPGVFSH